MSKAPRDRTRVLQPRRGLPQVSQVVILVGWMIGILAITSSVSPGQVVLPTAGAQAVEVNPSTHVLTNPTLSAFKTANTLQTQSTALDGISSSATSFGLSLLNYSTSTLFLNGVTGVTTNSFGIALLSASNNAALLTLGGLGSAADKTAGTAAGNVPVLDSGGHLLSSVMPTLAGTGTVTNVGLTGNAMFNPTGTPITSSGNLNLDWVTEAANLVLAGPATGAAAIPTFRSLVLADIPTGYLLGSTLGNLTVARGGTGSLTGSITLVHNIGGGYDPYTLSYDGNTVFTINATPAFTSAFNQNDIGFRFNDGTTNTLGETFVVNDNSTSVVDTGSLFLLKESGALVDRYFRDATDFPGVTTTVHVQTAPIRLGKSLTTWGSGTGGAWLNLPAWTVYGPLDGSAHPFNGYSLAFAQSSTDPMSLVGSYGAATYPPDGVMWGRSDQASLHIVEGGNEESFVGVLYAQRVPTLLTTLAATLTFGAGNGSYVMNTFAAGEVFHVKAAGNLQKGGTYTTSNFEVQIRLGTGGEVLLTTGSATVPIGSGPWSIDATITVITTGTGTTASVVSDGNFTFNGTGYQLSKYINVAGGSPPFGNVTDSGIVLNGTDGAIAVYVLLPGQSGGTTKFWTTTAYLERLH